MCDTLWRYWLTHVAGRDQTYFLMENRTRRPNMAGEFEEIRGRLEAIAEELADLALVRLRESIDAGGHELPIDEKRLTRARRAVEKAAHLLDEPDHSNW